MPCHRLRLAATLVLSASTVAACGRPEVGASPPPPEVAVATAEVAMAKCRILADAAARLRRDAATTATR